MEALWKHIRKEPLFKKGIFLIGCFIGAVICHLIFTGFPSQLLLLASTVLLIVMLVNVYDFVSLLYRTKRKYFS
ncbi:hypothetical protein HLI_21100 (plasmid) [Halobacillus litoralis]|uniref:Uncharacterized protein n=1 Tax=Halobacillus litoralis TaxID=45668 RepID=A0A410MJ54_9BACI|nr:hypothetical protein HLI_21100 [Halobacillus litoralis]